MDRIVVENVSRSEESKKGVNQRPPKREPTEDVRTVEEELTVTKNR